MGIDRTTTGSLAAVATVLLVGMLVVAPLAATISVEATSTPGPSDFAAVSTASNDVPTAQQTGGIGAAADAIASSTLVNRSASTTSVSVTTVAATRGLSTTCAAVDGGPQYCDSPRLAINISDDVAREGREVAIPKSALVDATGEVPTTVYGRNNETGGRWSASTSVRDGYVVFEVPHFSTNTVTFAGEVHIGGSPAANGTKWTYSLDSVDNVGNYSIDLTGVETTETETETGVDLGPSSSQSIAVGGNLDPGGPASGSPEVSVALPVTEGEASYDIQSQLSGDASDVDVAGNYAYVASRGSNSLYVFDVSTPTSPSHVATLTNSSHMADPRAAVADGSGHVYVGAGGTTNNLVAVDVSTPSSPSIVGVYEGNANSGPYGTFDLKYDGGYVYGVSKYQDWIAAWDVSTPSNPGLADALEDTAKIERPGGLDLRGSYLYVTGNDSASMAVVDVSSPSTLSFAGTVSDTTQLDYSQDVDVSPGGNYAYVSQFNGEITVVDVSTPSSPSVSSNYAPSEFGGIQYMNVAGDHLLVADRDGPLHSLDLSTPSSPSLVDTDTSTSYGKGMVPTGSYLYSTGRNKNKLIVSDNVTSEMLSSLDVSDGQGNSATIGTVNPGETASASLALSKHATSLSWSGSGPSEIDTTLDMTERTTTEDPVVEVNGQTTSYSGQLASGETTSLTTDTAWIQSGENTVNLTVSPSVSGDAPTPKVEVDYRHDSDDQQNVTFANQQWTERYNVSKTYASDRQNAYLNISHSRQVVGMRHLEIRWNQSGGWSTVSTSNYFLTGNDLALDLSAAYSGSTTIPATTTVEVRSNASRVSTMNVTIEVVEATPVEQPLASKIRIKSVSGTPEIGVGPTAGGDRVHHLTDESYSNPSEYVIIDDTGAQTLHLPNAEAGSTAIVRNVSTEVRVETTGGDVRLSVLSTGSPPRFDVSPGPAGSNDNVTFVYHSTTSGEQYELYSASVQDVIDKATASSPVYLDGSDSNQVLEIRLLGSGGGGGAVVAPGGSGPSTGPIPLALVFIGVIVAIVAFVLVGRRFGLDSRRQTILLVVGGGVVGLIGLEVVSTGSVVGSVGSTIGSAFSTPGGIIVAALSLFVGSFLLIRRLELPRWMLGVVGIPLGIWVLDALSSGSFTSGLGEISALVWLLLLIGGIAIVYRALKGRPVKVVAGRLR
jgi:hypothetical protein